MRDELITNDELAAWLKVPRTTGYRIGREDLIPGACVRIGRHMRFRRSVVEQWIAAGGSLAERGPEPVAAA